MDSLKPCPFCGGTAARLDLLGLPETDPSFGGSVIECTKCGACSAVEFGFKENLTSNWNRRDGDNAALPDLLAALKTAVAHIEHMAKWINRHNAGRGHNPDFGGYVFESLGEDMPGLRAAIAKAEGREGA